MRVLQAIKENYILTFILVFAAALRFYHIDFQSVWLDELHTLTEANPNLSWKEFHDILMNSEMNPPLYFFIMRYLFLIFGYKAIVMRIFSAIVGTLCLYALYRLCKELFDRRTALIATLLLCVNCFHLYYSQEGRPYVMLTLFTLLSFYRLIVYIKNPIWKNAVWYGVFTALMIHSQLFGLFVMVSQYLILLFFFILIEKEKRKAFFINSFLSTLTTIVLLLPMTELLLKSLEMKNFWIPLPTLDVYTQIFREFFGGSEMLIALITIILVLYFIALSKQKSIEINYENVIKNKTVFGFVILSMWILVVILIPLIRSYLSVPMIVSRYFIVVLPAVLLILATAINEFDNKVIRYSIVSIFVVFSLTDIVAVKNYYNSINKAQFREATSFVIENHSKDEPVVSGRAWHMNYFFNTDKSNIKLIDKPLDAYIAEMAADPTKVKAFWYLDAFGNEYNPSEASKNFIDNNLYIENNYDGFQAYAKHFILLKDVPKTLDISKFKDLQEYNGDRFVFAVEGFENANNSVTVSGWAYFEKQEATKTDISIVLVKDGAAKRFITQKVSRPDVTSYFKNDFNVDNSGFKSTYDITNLEPGKYQVAIYLNNKDTKKEGLILTDKFVEK